MDKLKHKEYDFSSKLRQASVIERLKEYIKWQRNATKTDDRDILPNFSPVSINLDLTSSCNFACPHCVDSKIINTGEFLKLEDIKRSVDTLKSHGILSIILLGGGEPTLHKDFGEIARYIKSKGVQLGIVTNGSRLSQVKNIVDLLEKEDWLRISLDSGSQNTFVKSHKPKTGITLDDILLNAQEIKTRNPLITLGYSFVIVWEGVSINGNELCRNIGEMSEAVRLASEHSFDYVSFKPCLIRLQDSQKESLLDKSDEEKEKRIIEEIKSNLEKAESAATGNLKVLKSVNLRAMLDNELRKLKRQPKRCHMQFFSTVVTPSGIFHCPAFRGVEKAKIGECSGYAGEDKFNETLKRLTWSIETFDAGEECKVVACFYHHVNWWVENFIRSDKSIDKIEATEDDNFFL
jgi:MoaA/NifB/PqqE/SkfB family radical SAM enzyme